MDILTIAVILFLIMETGNIFILYFFPGSTKANGTGVFKAFEESARYPEIHKFIRYLIYWVAGVKLIFVALLAIIYLYGDLRLKQIAMGALILSVATFYWRLYPLIKKMDHQKTLKKPGYSKILFRMISLMLLVMGSALIISLRF